MKNICVVEDNGAIRKLFSTILKKKNYNVSDFESGESLLKAVESTKPDLIVMDILLPDINGTDLIGKVRAIPVCKSIPIIAVTGFATDQDAIKFEELGFNAYMSKPINTTVFLDEVNKLLQ